MSNTVKMAILIAITLWASAFVGIREGLHEYSPEGLALLRYLVASALMGIIYFHSSNRNEMSWRDRFALLATGVIGIGIYNITLNHGEEVITSGMASFITSQSPIITTIFAVIFLGEKLNFYRAAGFIVSIMGMALITAGEMGGFKWDMSMTYILLATLSGSFYTIMQKPFLKKFHVIEATTYVMWGGTLFLMLYTPQMIHDLRTASFSSTMMVIYLGVFPAALGYLAWSYALANIPATRAVSFLYFMPFLATLLGWILLGEAPLLISIVGGLLAIVGVWLVNRSYRVVPVISE